MAECDDVKQWFSDLAAVQKALKDNNASPKDDLRAFSLQAPSQFSTNSAPTVKAINDFINNGIGTASDDAWKAKTMRAFMDLVRTDIQTELADLYYAVAVTQDSTLPGDSGTDHLDDKLSSLFKSSAAIAAMQAQLKACVDPAFTGQAAALSPTTLSLEDSIEKVMA